MTYDISVTGNYAGRPSYYIQLYVRRDQTDEANNRSSYAWALYSHWNGSGSNGSWLSNPQPWSVNVGGQIFSGSSHLNHANVGRTILLGSSSTGWAGHDGNGYLNIGVSASVSAGGPFGFASTSGTLITDRIPKPPVQNGAPTFTSILPTSATASWAGSTNNNGANVDQYKLRIRAGSPADGAGFVDHDLGATTLSKALTGLKPGTQYSAVVYAHNRMGYSVKSAEATFRTPSGAYPFDGSTWRPSELLARNSTNTAWVSGELLYRNAANTAWIPAS